MKVREARLVYSTTGRGTSITGKKLLSSREVYELMQPIVDNPMESFWIVALNARHQVQFITCISLGNATATVVDPKSVFDRIFKHPMTPITAIIAVHNHPSGNAQPSHEDHKVTRQLHAACNILEVEFIDHVIITQDDRFSFKDAGELQ